MDADFAGALRAARNLVGEQKLVEATSVIRSALSGRMATSSGSSNEAMPKDKVDESPVTRGSVVELNTRWQQPQPSRIAAAWRGGARQEALGNFPSHTLPRFTGLTVVTPPSVMLKTPTGAQFLSRSFTCASGSRNYKLYIPSRSQVGRRAFIVMLHGGTQDADDFAAGTRMNALAEERGFIVAYPRQSKAANASLCWNWFSHENQKRGRGEPAIIAGITQEVVAEYDADPTRVFVAGLSAGGAMAAVMGATYPDLYAGVGVHSGLPYRSAADLPSAFAAMRGDSRGRGRRSKKSGDGARLPTIVFHGDADNIVHPSNAANMIELETGDEKVEHLPQAIRHATRAHTRTIVWDKTGAVVAEQWLIHGSGHAWSGGSPDGTYTDPNGPDASREMLRFFFDKGSAVSRLKL